MVLEKQKEWQHINELRVSIVEEQSKRREHELEQQNGEYEAQVTRLRAKYGRLKTDFEYNTKLVSARDEELGKYDEALVELQTRLATRDQEAKELARRHDAAATEKDILERRLHEIQALVETQMQELNRARTAEQQAASGAQAVLTQECEALQAQLRLQEAEFQELLASQQRVLASQQREAAQRQEDAKIVMEQFAGEQLQALEARARAADDHAAGLQAELEEGAQAQRERQLEMEALQGREQELRVEAASLRSELNGCQAGAQRTQAEQAREWAAKLAEAQRGGDGAREGLARAKSDLREYKESMAERLGVFRERFETLQREHQEARECINAQKDREAELSRQLAVKARGEARLLDGRAALEDKLDGLRRDAARHRELAGERDREVATKGEQLSALLSKNEELVRALEGARGALAELRAAGERAGEEADQKRQALTAALRGREQELGEARQETQAARQRGEALEAELRATQAQAVALRSQKSSLDEELVQARVELESSGRQTAGLRERFDGMVPKARHARTVAALQQEVQQLRLGEAAHKQKIQGLQRSLREFKSTTDGHLQEFCCEKDKYKTRLGAYKLKVERSSHVIETKDTEVKALNRELLRVSMELKAAKAELATARCALDDYKCKALEGDKKSHLQQSRLRTLQQQFEDLTEHSRFLRAQLGEIVNQRGRTICKPGRKCADPGCCGRKKRILYVAVNREHIKILRSYLEDVREEERLADISEQRHLRDLRMQAPASTASLADALGEPGCCGPLRSSSSATLLRRVRSQIGDFGISPKTRDLSESLRNLVSKRSMLRAK